MKKVWKAHEHRKSVVRLTEKVFKTQKNDIFDIENHIQL